MRLTKIFLLVVVALSTATGCKRVSKLPPLVAPVMPRQSLDIQYMRLRIVVGEALDRTGVAGGVVDTGATGGSRRRSGSILIAPPTRDIGAVVEDRGAPGGPLSMVSFKDGHQALSQTIGATLQGVAAVSERFEVVTGDGGCDLALKTWITGVSSSQLHVEQILESCFTGSAVASVNGTVRFSEASAKDVLLDRADVIRLVKKLVASLPEPTEMGKGTVLSRDGHFITINLGSENKVKKGMTAFAVTYGDRKVDPKSGITLGDETFTGDLYVFAVYPKMCRAWVMDEPANHGKGHHSRVRVGDYVIFK